HSYQTSHIQGIYVSLNITRSPYIYTLSLHDALPISLLTRGLDKPGSNTFVIHGLIFLLVVYAFGYLAFSAAVAIKEFDELGLRFWQKGVFGLSFMLLYLVLFVAAIYFGCGKIA